jgi:hypothetical protein
VRHASSLLGGALLGSSIVVPILAGGDAVDGDAFVIFVSGLLAVCGIGIHVTAAGIAHARARTPSVPATGAEEYSRPAHARREQSADSRSIV